MSLSFILETLGQNVFAAPMDDFYQAQAQYFSQNRSMISSLNPLANPNMFQDTREVEKFTGGLNSDQYGYHYARGSSEVYVYDKKDGNKLVALIPISTKEELSQFSPKSFHKKLIQKAAEMTEAGAAGVHQTMMNLPMEASVFYMAMGSVAAFSLFANAGQDPAALKSFINGQASPVGITSLLMFLGAQNATANVASLVIKNPKWYGVIPTLSMFAATLVQNYTSSFMTDRNVKLCIASWFNKSIQGDDPLVEPCEKAYQYFTMQKPWEFAPGIVSMFISTGLTFGAQYGVARTALTLESLLTSDVIKNEARRTLLRMSLVRFAGFMNPGSVPYLTVTGVWVYLTKASNLAFFASVDRAISNGVTFAAKNLQESVSLPFVDSIRKTSDELVDKMELEKNHAWSYPKSEEACAKYPHGDCSGLLETLVKFQEQMQSWRAANIADVMESYQSWQLYLGDLAARVSASEEFYRRFVNEAKKYGQTGADNRLERLYPLWGISTTKTRYYDETFFTDPYLPESEQVSLATTFAAKMRTSLDQLIKSGDFILRGENLKLYNEVSVDFKNNSGRSLDEKIKLAKGMNATKHWLQAMSHGVMGPDYKVISPLFAQLGQPEPKLVSGEGFISAMDRSTILHRYYQYIDFHKDEKAGHLEKFRSYSDALMASMICGPDPKKNESLIEEFWGFRAHFRPPRLSNFIDVAPNLRSVCQVNFPNQFYQRDDGLPFIAPFRLRGGQKAKYFSPFEYLKMNLDDDLYKMDFSQWWRLHTESQVSDAFKNFENKYNEIIASLVGRLNQTTNSTWNRSNTVANGLMVNIFQELRVYLMVLSEVLKDHASLEGRTAGLAPLLAEAKKSPTFAVPLTAQEAQVPVPEIVKYQARGDFADYSYITHKTKTLTLLKFEKDIEGVFANMNFLLKKLKVQKNGDDTLIVGDVDNADFDKSLDKIDELTKNIAVLFGVAAPVNDDEGIPTFDEAAKRAKTAPLVLLDDGTKVLVVRLLNNIEALAGEVKSFSMIANAVSYKNIENLRQQAAQSQAEEAKINAVIENYEKNKSHNQ